MSGPESNKPDDQLLDEFLAGQGAVRETYRAAAQERAPAHLDDGILQTAQTAMRQPRAVRRPRWQTPVAAAAVMVLSFGVFLQVQRDPVSQQQALERPVAATAPAAPAAANTVQAPEANMADAPPEAVAPREAAQAKPKPFPAVPEKKSKPAVLARPTEQRRDASMPVPPPSPPPPATEMSIDAAPALAAAASSMPEERAKVEAMADARESEMRSARAADSSRAAAGAGMESRLQAASPQRESVMGKSLRAPSATQFMAAPQGGAAEAAIEQWAASCQLPSVFPQGGLQWRGLEVRGWSAGADAERRIATLRFASVVKRGEIVAALGPLAARTEFSRSDCATPVVRELREEAGWALVCECTDP